MENVSIISWSVNTDTDGEEAKQDSRQNSERSKAKKVHFDLTDRISRLRREIHPKYIFAFIFTDASGVFLDNVTYIHSLLTLKVLY